MDQIEGRVATIKLPTLDFKSARGDIEGAKSSADLAEAFGPAANQIRNSLQGAFSGLEPTFRRLATQVEALTGGSLAHFRRLDSEVRFPQFMGAIAKLRGFVQGQFASMSEMPLRFAKLTDQALGGLAFGAKLKNQVDSLRSFTSNSAREIARIKAPGVSFAPAVTGVNAVKGAADRATTSFKGLGLQIAGALGLVGVGYKLVGFLKESIKDASDLNEQINKTNVILGAGAPAVQAFAGQMAKDFGSSRTATLRVATEIAGLGKGLGKLEGDKLSSFATNLTRLAADVSSIDNKSLKEVGDAFRIGLSGEQSDVLKGLGVLLTETTVKSYALAHGLMKVGQDLSEETKLMARAGLISEGLAFANGDLARTINDPANAYRRFTGQVENLGASLGTSLLPVVNEVLAGLNKLAGGTEDALGRSKTSFADWAASSAFAVSTLSIYLENWDDTVKLTTLSAEQTFANFSARVDKQFQKMGQSFGDAFNHPLLFINDELEKLVVEVGNHAHNLKELLTKGTGGDFNDVHKGFVSPLEAWKKKNGLIGPQVGPPVADLSKEIQAIADRIEARRAAKPMAPLPAPPRPVATVDGVAQKAAAKAQSELEGFAKSLKDKVRKPLEEYGESMKQAKLALDAGLISQEQFKRADAFARKDAGLDTVKLAGAQEIGSREAYSTLVAAMSARGNDVGQRLQQQVVRNGNQAVIELKALNKKLGAANDPTPLNMMVV